MEIHFIQYSSIISDIIHLLTSTSKLLEVFCARLPLVKGVASIGRVQFSPSPYERIRWTRSMHRSQLFGVNAWKSSTHPWRLKAGVRRMLGSLTFPHSCHLRNWRNMETWKHATESSWASQPSEKLLEQPEGHGKVSASQLNLLCSAWKVLLNKKHGKKVK